MLLTILAVPTALFVTFIALLCRKAWLAKSMAGGLAIWLVLYAVLLFGSSLLSTEKVLAVNEPKEYCGFYIDCHLHAVVKKVEAGDHSFQHKPKGKYLGVVVKVYSNANNPNIRFRLLEPEAVITDSQGNKFERVEAVEDDLYSQPVWLGAGIQGDETLEKELVFDIPTTSTGLKLELTEGYGIDKYIEAVLIGDEDSVWHKHTYFDIPEPKETAGVK